MNKQIIIFDVDGVILNFNVVFNHYMLNKHNIQINVNPNNWNFDWTGDLGKLDFYIKEFINSDPILPLVDNNLSNFINNLKNNYKIIIVTAYTNKQNRISNLDLFNIYYDDIIFTDQLNKVDVINSLNPIAVFEDCPSHVENLLKSNIINIFVPDI